MTAKALSNAALRALKVQGTNIFVANGVSAGQKAPHFMVHIIPRKEGDGMTALNIKRNAIDETELSSLNHRIKTKFNELMGINREEPLRLDREEKAEEEESRDEELEEPEEPKVDDAAKPEKEEGIDLDSIANVLLGGKDE